MMILPGVYFVELSIHMDSSVVSTKCRFGKENMCLPSFTSSSAASSR